MFSFVSIVYIMVIVSGLIWIFKKREEEEKGLGLKLFGYFLLGTFSVYFEMFVIPVGFLLFLFLKPKLNKKIKTYAATFGLLMFLINISSQFIQYLFERY